MTSASIPPTPVDGNFITTIEDTINSCASGMICSCMHTIFTHLTASGFGQNVISTKENNLCFNFASNQGVPVSDLILAVFQQDAQSVLLPFPANLRKLAYNCTSQDLYVETTQAGGTLNLFKDLLTVSSLTLKVTLSNIQQSPEVTYLEVSGLWTFGEKEFYLWLNMTTSEWNFGAQLVFEEDIDLIAFIASALGLNTLNGPLGDSIFLTDILVRGIYDTENLNIVVVLQGTIRIKEWFEQTVCVFIHHQLTNVGRLPPELALISDCENVGFNLQLGGLIHDVTGFDISGIPFLHNLMLPKLHLIYNTPNFPFSTIELTGFDLPNFNLAFDPSGFKLLFDFAIEGLPEVQWVFRFENGTVVFQPLEAGSGFRIGDVLAAISNSLTLPNIDLFGLDLFGIQLVEMHLDFELRTLHLVIEIPQTITVFFDELQVQNIMIDLEVSFQSSLELSHFGISGSLIIAGSLFSVRIQLEDELYNLQACADDVKFSVSGLISGIQGSSQTLSLVQKSGLADLGIYHPCMLLKFKANQYPENMCFSADILRSDFGQVGVGACVSRSRQWIYAFEIQQLVLAKLLAPVAGNGVRRVALLNQRLDVAVVVAPTMVSKLPLRGDLLSDLTNVISGVTIVVRASWPSTCSSDTFCVIARDLLGEDAMFFLKVEILDSGGMNIEAEVRDFQLGSLTLSSASLQIGITPTKFSLGIQASVDLSTPPVTLTGALRLKLPSLSVALEMSMSGCWNSAFGISILDICNLYLAVTLTPGVPVPGIAFGARVRLGSEKCYRLEATAYVAVGSPVPEDNFFYAEMGPLTLQKVLDLFCISFTLPTFLGDTGFPNGFGTSYALTDISLPTIPLTISRGFYFRGTLNIFGFQIFSEIVLDPPRLIDIYTRLRPLHLAGGLLAMYESRDVHSRGPFLHVYIAAPVVEAEASGYVKILGIEAEATLLISNSGFEVSVSGSIFGVLEAELCVYSSFGNLLNSEFRVSGRLRLNILKKLEEGVLSVLRKVAEVADRIFSAAQERLKEGKKVFDKAVAALRDAEREVRNARSKVADARRKLDGLRHRLDSLCKFRSCKRGEIGHTSYSLCIE